jgi:hypothetical protein
MDLNASVICCEIRLRLWLMQKRYEAEQAARGQEGDASNGGNHDCVEEHWHITTLAGPWQGHYRAGRGQEKGAHTSAFLALLMMV